MKKQKLLTFIFITSLFFSTNLFSQTFNFTLVVETNYPTGVMFDSSDYLWWVVQGEGLFELDGITYVDHSTSFVTTNLTSCDVNGTTKWTGGYGGLIRYDGTPANYTSSDVLQGYAIYDVDVEGDDLWLAMENEGATHFDGTTWTHYTAADGLIGSWFTAITRDNLGNIWLSSVDFSVSSVGAVSKFDGTSWTTFSAAEGISLGEITSIFADSNGDIWIGGDGVMKYDGTSWVSIPVTITNNVYSIMEDDAGNMWFGEFNQNLHMYDGTTVYNTSPPDVFSGRSDGMNVDASGDLHVCLDDGIYKVDIITEIDENNLNTVASLYPNPANNTLNVETNDIISSIEIYSISGKKVYHNSFNSDKLNIDISNISTGQYIVKIITENNVENIYLVKD